MKVLSTLITLVLLIMLSAYIAAGWEEVKLTDEIRSAKAPGKFLNLEQGVIHYLERGPENGPVIVLVHGFSTPSFIFEQNAIALAEAGNRVIQFDHFGRGWSDRPSARYDVEFYDQELIQVLDALGLKQPVGLIGLSMGGIISAEFVANHPERISKLALLVPAGLALSGNADGALNRLVNMPILGVWLWRVFARSILLGDGQYQEAHLSMENRLQGDVTEQMKYKGYFQALLSSYRNLPMRDRDTTFSRLSATGVPTLAIFGNADQTISVESADRLRTLMPSAKVEVIANGTHGVNYQMHQLINPLLTEFFRTQ